eukprot:CAMPEP_0171099514 /NCGR_PEP_ID=MMETSP0766_2-20121228/51789_1 /TAXON_ID=439317 /ORGANISM="Gambierdiscus australes, Strain CAWD 149" /LENGTH=449 /DNA_ID=CAMNT_0011559159 /DNA_START=62 /DNA_END=1408 /DNA_ORIENTATION=+
MGAASCGACLKSDEPEVPPEYADEKPVDEEEEEELNTLERSSVIGSGLSPSAGHGNGSVSTATPLSLQLPFMEACSDGSEECCTALKAHEFVRRLQVCEAATLLQPRFHDRDVDADADLQQALTIQLKYLGPALTQLGDHPGLRNVGIDRKKTAVGFLPNELLGVDVPSSPEVARKMTRDRLSSPKSSISSAESSSGAKRDVVEISFNLDDQGRRVDAEVEFFPDGEVQIQWAATDLPVPLVYVICMVNEVDLLGDIVPFIHSSGVLHQFPLNEGDRLVRIISKPPIPFVGGLEAVTQRFGFDLLDTPWEGICLVDLSPPWSAESTETGKSPELWRGTERPVQQKGMRQVEAKNVVALGRPAGKDGELTTILFSAYGNIKVPRSMLPNRLLKWLVPLVGRFVYNRALERVAKIDNSEHGRRLRSSSFYAAVRSRIARFVQEKARAGKAD